MANVTAARLVLPCLLAAACVEEPDFPERSVASRRQLATGRFGYLGIDGSREEGAFAVALRDRDEDGGTLTVIPFEGGEACDVGHAAVYSTFGVSTLGGVRLSDRPVRIQLLDELDELGGGVIHHAGAGCDLRPDLLEEPVRGPLLFDWIEGTGFFAWTASGEVVRFDPWEETSEQFATGVTSLDLGWEESDGEPKMLLWLVEDGELVVRDSGGDERLRVGSGVTDVALAPPGLGAAWVDTEGLHVVSEPDLEQQLLADDGCEPKFLQSWDLPPEVPGPALAYLAPCADRRLVIEDLTGTFRVEPELGGARVGGIRSLDGWIFYVLGESREARIGEVFAFSLATEEEPMPIREGHSTDLWGILPLGGAFLVVTDYEGGKGELGVWLPFGVGFPDPKREQGLYFGGIPDVADFWFGEYLAVLSDFDGESGTLMVVDPYDLLEEPEGLGPDGEGIRELLTARGVPKGGFRFAQAVSAIDYIEDWDATDGVGTLRTWIIEDFMDGPGSNGADAEGFLVDEDVAEFREVLWPDAGMLYAIGRGDREGLWYADWVE